MIFGSRDLVPGSLLVLVIWDLVFQVLSRQAGNDQQWRTWFAVHYLVVEHAGIFTGHFQLQDLRYARYFVEVHDLYGNGLRGIAAGVVQPVLDGDQFEIAVAYIGAE